MSARHASSSERRRLYRSGWLVVVFAMASYLLVAYAEQGSAGAGLRIVPNDPLPFERHAGAGVDLASFSSLQAVEWLEQADTSQVPLILLPVDGDIVAAFNNPDAYLAARSAVDQLVGSAGDTAIALCLRRPIAAIDETILAEAAVTALVESYTDRVTYIGACTSEASRTWETSVLDILGTDPPDGAHERILAPVSVGAPLRLSQPVGPAAASSIFLDGLSGDDYVVLRLGQTQALSPDEQQQLATIRHDRSHIATSVVAPVDAENPQAFVSSLDLGGFDDQELSEGFNNVSSPLIQWTGDWTTTTVGDVTYMRTQEQGAWIATEFVGTEIWAVGIAAPDSGRIGIWVDVEDPATAGEPDRIVDMSRTQARDQAILLVDGLPAARHQITVVAADGDVTLSGFFVAGRPEAGLSGVFGALGLIITAIAGLGVVLTVAVDDLRARIGLEQRDDDEDYHPRVFRRDV